jgi:hypothetical protein
MGLLDQLPRPNALAISWFYGEHQKETLILKPGYQRNPIWSIGQKCFLIDSLIAGFPLPQVYINVTSKGRGAGMQTVYEVVDGQQRLTSILEFLADGWVLAASAASKYPVSAIYKKHLGKSFSELPRQLQERIWNYPLVAQELRGWTAPRIRELFRRLNYVVEKLTSQELRHSQYLGEFLHTVEDLAKEDVWESLDLFTRRDYSRMVDIEFVSELFVIAIDGIQDGQKTLDSFFAKFDVEFPRKTVYLKLFRATVESIQTIAEVIRTTRMSKKADFYGLFAAVCELIRERSEVIDLSPAIGALQQLHDALAGNTSRLRGINQQYHSTVIEGANKATKRADRSRILKGILETLV